MWKDKMFSSLLLGKSKLCLWFLLMRERAKDDMMQHWVMCKITQHFSSLQQTNINTFPQQKWFYKQRFSRELFSSGCWSLSDGKLNKSTNSTINLTTLHQLTFDFHTTQQMLSGFYYHVITHCQIIISHIVGAAIHVLPARCQCNATISKTSNIQAVRIHLKINFSHDWRS